MCKPGLLTRGLCVHTLDLAFNDIFRSGSLNYMLQRRERVGILSRGLYTIQGLCLLQESNPLDIKDTWDKLICNCPEQCLQLCQCTHRMKCTAALLDFPHPLRPTRAYLWPSFKRSLASVRISKPSPRAFALPLPVDFFSPPAAAGDVTVMFKLWMSN